MRALSLPSVAPCSLVYHPMQQGVQGFRTGDFLAPDKIHPNDRGHGYVAQLLVHFLQRTLAAEEQRQLAEAWRAHWERQRAAEAGDGGAGASLAAGLLTSVQPPADRSADAQAAANAAAGAAAVAEAVAAADAAAGAANATEAAGGAGNPVLHTRFATADALALPPPMLAGAEALVAERCLRDRLLMILVDANKSSGFRWA